MFRRVIGKIILVSLTLIGFGFIFVNYINTHAEDYNINSNELYNETNTYRYSYNDETDNGVIDESSFEIKNEYLKSKSNKARYDLNDKTNVKVDKEEAKITVFTHGWTGAYTDWTNNNNSLVDKLAIEMDANVYVFEFYENGITKKTNYKLNQFVDGNLSSIEEGDLDFSKHMIILFQALNPGYDNDYIYTQFNYMMARVLYASKNKNNQVLPRVNLIGHSRGGLTNMQYALDHPDVVENMYSLGTPYVGTTTAGLDRSYFNGAIGRLFFGSAQRGESDLSNENAYGTYVKRWNENYERYYSHINLIALGASTSISYLLSLIINSFDSIPVLPVIARILGVYELTKSAVALLISGIAIGSALTPIFKETNFNQYLAKLRELTSSIKLQHIPEKFISSDIIIDNIGFNPIDIEHLAEGFILLLEDLPLFLASEIGFDGYQITWDSDIAVNLDSQMGKGLVDGQMVSYKGMHSEYKIINPFNTNPDKITHVKELKDSELHNIVINDFINRNRYKKIWSYSFNDDNTLSINGYYDDVSSNNGVLSIPSSINIDGKDYAVTKIGDAAFSPLSYAAIEDNTIGEIKKVIIPSSITIIGKSAFKDLKKLEEVVFDKNSNLKTIEESAFSGSSLKNIEIPKRTKIIEDGAFSNSEIENITFDGNLDYLGVGVFKGCNLKNVIEETNYLDYSNGILTKDNGKTLTYIRNDIEYVALSNDIETIDYYSFAGSNIKSIDLNNVKCIYESAFISSKLENVSGGDKLEYANLSSFVGTPYYSDINDKLIIGKVLLYDNINEEVYYVDEGIERIGYEALNGSSKIIIISDSVVEISANAFANVSGLEKVFFKSSNPADLSFNSFNADTKIYVPYNYYSVYDKDLDFDDYVINKQEIIVYYYENNSLIATKKYYFGQLLSNIPTKEHYDIKSIIDSEGNSYNFGDLLYFIDNQSLFVEYEKTKYEFVFNVNEDEIVEEYNYGDTLNIGIPQ